MNQELTIVRATLDHIPTVASLLDAYRQYYGQPSDLAAAEAFLSTRLAQDESVVFFAFLEGRAAGFTQLYPSFSSVSLARIWILNDLFVAEAARRSGVGQELLREATKFAAKNSAARLELSTETENQVAQSLYESQGWKQEKGFFQYVYEL